jgi:predicted transcriptional regulator of viral defense system
VDEQGRVYIYFTIDEIMDTLGCARQKADRLLSQLDKAGLVERKRQGLGKPNILYPLKFEC